MEWSRVRQRQLPNCRVSRQQLRALAGHRPESGERRGEIGHDGHSSPSECSWHSVFSFLTLFFLVPLEVTPFLRHLELRKLPPPLHQ